MNEGGRREQTIDGGHRVGDVEESPPQRHRLVNLKDPLGLRGPMIAQPSVENASRYGIAASKRFDAAPKLTEYEHAGPKR